MPQTQTITVRDTDTMLRWPPIGATASTGALTAQEITERAQWLLAQVPPRHVAKPLPEMRGVQNDFECDGQVRVLTAYDPVSDSVQRAFHVLFGASEE
jgi:hypothetical protein